jgi:hypothetical protein
MHASRIALVIASALGMLCTFLPWASAPIVGSIYGTRGDGWISFVLCAVGLLLSLAGARQSAQPVASAVISTLCGAGAAAVGLFNLINLENKLAESPFGAAVSIGPGMYLLILAGAAMTLLPNILRGRTQVRVVTHQHLPPAQSDVWPPNR